MKLSHPQDPIRTFQRKAAATRRAGKNTRCTCGETRIKALVGSTGVCAECQRNREGRAVMDKHHVAGKRNSSVTIAVSANDHRS